MLTTCYKYTRSLPAAAATAEVLRSCHVPQRCREGVLGQALAAALPDSPTQPLGCPSPPHQTQPPPWAALGMCHVKLVCRLQLLHLHRQPKGSGSCSTGSKWTTENTGAATIPPALRAATTLRHQLMMKHLLRSCLQPGAQHREQFLFLHWIDSGYPFRSRFAGCCLLRCMEVAILMEISVAVPT